MFNLYLTRHNFVQYHTTAVIFNSYWKTSLRQKEGWTFKEQELYSFPISPYLQNSVETDCTHILKSLYV